MLYEYILLIFTFFVMAFLILFCISLLNAIFRGVPQVGTFGEPKVVLERELPKILHEGKTLLDLGSGTGKMARFCARECSLRVIGYEIDISNWLIAKFLNVVHGIKGVEYRRKNFYTLTEKDFEHIDYVYIYLFPELMKKIEERLVPKMKKGTIIVTNGFVFPNLKPYQTFKRETGKDVVYVYEV